MTTYVPSESRLKARARADQVWDELQPWFDANHFVDVAPPQRSKETSWSESVGYGVVTFRCMPHDWGIAIFVGDARAYRVCLGYVTTAEEVKELHRILSLLNFDRAEAEKP